MKISTTSATVKKTSAVSGPITGRIKGQGLTEYAIILSLVAIAAIGATSFFGDSVKASFVALGSELTGGTQYDMVGKTAASLKKADGGVSGTTTLKNYRD
ncbi:MAG: Flp family type IVb pilin [Granulosicoccus sp.]